MSSDSGDESAQSFMAPRSKPIGGEESPGSAQRFLVGTGYRRQTGEDTSDAAWTPDQMRSGPAFGLVRTLARSEESVVGAASVAGDAITGFESPLLSKAGFWARSGSAERSAALARSSWSQESQETQSLFPAIPGGVGTGPAAADAAPAQEAGGLPVVAQPRQDRNGREAFRSEMKAAGEGHSRAMSTEFSLGKGHTALLSRPALGAAASPTMLHGDFSDGGVRIDREQVSEAKAVEVQDVGWPDEHAGVNPPSATRAATAGSAEDPILAAAAAAGTLRLEDEGWMSNATTASATGLRQTTPRQGEHAAFSGASFAMAMSESTADGKAVGTAPSKGESTVPNLGRGGGGGSRPGESVIMAPERSGLMSAGDWLGRQGTVQLPSFVSSDSWQIPLETDCSASPLPMAHSSRPADRARCSALIVDRRSYDTPTLDGYPRVGRQQDVMATGAASSIDDRDRHDARGTDGENTSDIPPALNSSERIRSGGWAALDAKIDDGHFSAHIVGHPRQMGNAYGGNRNPFDDFLWEPPPPQQQRCPDRASAVNARCNTRSGDEGVRNSLPWGWGAVEAPSSTVPARHGRADSAGAVADEGELTGVGRGLRDGYGGESGPRVVMVDGREWDDLKRENDALRRQADLAEKRCASLP